MVLVLVIGILAGWGFIFLVWFVGLLRLLGGFVGFASFYFRGVVVFGGFGGCVLFWGDWSLCCGFLWFCYFILVGWGGLFVASCGCAVGFRVGCLR